MKKQTFYKNNILQDCSMMKKIFIIFKRKNFYTVNEIHDTKIEQSFREQRKKKNKEKRRRKRKKEEEET